MGGCCIWCCCERRAVVGFISRVRLAWLVSLPAMSGAIVGDIVGLVYEFDKHRSKYFPLFTGEWWQIYLFLRNQI